MSTANVQEEQQRFVLISQHNSISNLLCTGAFCRNTTKNVVPLHNDYTHVKLSPYLVMTNKSHNNEVRIK